MMLSTLTMPLCPMNTAKALWVHGAFSAPSMPVQLSLVSAPLAVQTPDPPLTWPSFLGPMAPSQ